VEPTSEWFCISSRCFRTHASIRVPHRLLARIPNLVHDTWVRYHLNLADAPPCPEEVTLVRIDNRLMERLRRHPERNESQYQSALRFWQAGFGDGYVWMENDEPLCINWLMTERHHDARRGLGVWCGMYPRIEPGVGVTEGIYTFRRGLRRRGGAATFMALAMFAKARETGLRELRTHIHHDNIAAHRWAARVGWRPFGTIHRYSIDLRGLRGLYAYLHDRNDNLPSPLGKTSLARF
jgi:RimJ/RimL family protein N-acetyltransferase